MDGTELRGNLRDMWDTRPARPREGRQIAGVAAAIARRYDIDPVLVRVAFVATAFTGGLGFLLYAAGWLALPRDGEVRRSGRQVPVLIGLLLIGLLAVGWWDDGRGGGVIVGLAVAFGLLFLLHRSRGEHRPAAPEVDQAMVSLVKEPTAPAWDPLGAAPFAWDLPEPSPAPPPPPVRRLPVTAVTLALALLAGGVTATVLLAAGALSLSSVPVLFGVVLAVLGLGLVVGSFLHAGRGLIPAAILVGALTWGAVAAPLEGWPSGGYGEFREAPTVAAELAPTYTASAGDFDLDLRRLDLTVGPDGDASPVRTSVRLGAGDVQVRVPADADVTFSGVAGLGRVAFEGRESTGPTAELTAVEDLGADGVRSDRLLEVIVTLNTGNVEVLRG